MTDPAKVLFDDYIIEIFTIVAENPGIRKSVLHAMLETTSYKPRALIEKLIECGLLEETRGEDNRTLRLISLTDEGERYYSLIEAMKSGKRIDRSDHSSSAAERTSVKN